MENYSPSPTLTNAERIEIFRIATFSFPKRNAEAIKRGMTDEELENALKQHLGIFGGSGGPSRLSVTYQGAGLKIWGGWRTINHVIEKPLFSGKKTIDMAREVYSIADREDRQYQLL